MMWYHGWKNVRLFSLQTCPADGTIMYCGVVVGDCLEQVKGVTYSLHGFLGPMDSFLCSALNSNVNQDSMTVCGSDLVTTSGNCLYQCVVYLAPGDYHHFHSPADWTVVARRHFPGKSQTSITGNFLFDIRKERVYVKEKVQIGVILLLLPTAFNQTKFDGNRPSISVSELLRITFNCLLYEFWFLQLQTNSKSWLHHSLSKWFLNAFADSAKTTALGRQFHIATATLIVVRRAIAIATEAAAGVKATAISLPIRHIDWLSYSFLFLPAWGGFLQRQRLLKLECVFLLKIVRFVPCTTVLCQICLLMLTRFCSIITIIEVVFVSQIIVFLYKCIEQEKKTTL